MMSVLCVVVLVMCGLIFVCVDLCCWLLLCVGRGVIVIFGWVRCWCVLNGVCCGCRWISCCGCVVV